MDGQGWSSTRNIYRNQEERNCILLWQEVFCSLKVIMYLEGIIFLQRTGIYMHGYHIPSCSCQWLKLLGRFTWEEAEKAKWRRRMRRLWWRLGDWFYVLCTCVLNWSRVQHKNLVACVWHQFISFASSSFLGIW